MSLSLDTMTYSAMTEDDVFQEVNISSESWYSKLKDLDVSKWLLLGSVGSGKTTLYNEIMNDSRPASSGVAAVTGVNDLIATSQKVHKIDDEDFVLIDSPGFGGLDDKFGLQELTKHLLDLGISASSKLDGIIFCTQVGRQNSYFAAEFDILKTMLDEDVMKFVMIVFTNLDKLDEPFDAWIAPNLRLLESKIGSNFQYGAYGVRKDQSASYDKVKNKLLEVARSKGFEKDYHLRTKAVDNLVNAKNPEEELKRSVNKAVHKIVNTPTILKIIHLIPIVGNITLMIEEVVKHYFHLHFRDRCSQDDD